MMDRGTVWNM